MLPLAPPSGFTSGTTARRLPCLAGIAVVAWAGCKQPARVSVHAQVCGWLCGNRANHPPRDPTDYAGIDCGTTARVRVLSTSSTSDGGVLSQTCVPLATGLSPLFDTGPTGGPAAPVKLFLTGATGSALVEVALYAPGGAATCPEDAPMVSLGRSEPFDLGSPPKAPILVPLGCHELCGGSPPSGITLSLSSVEPPPAPVSIPANADIGEIYAYEQLISTGGQCTQTPSTDRRPHGEFRSFQTVQVGNGGSGPVVFQGTFPSDPNLTAGCLALRIPGPPATTYACIQETGSNAQAWALSPSHLAAIVQNLRPPIGGDRNGLLVVGVLDASGAPSVGATVSFAATGEPAYYVSADFSSLSTAGVTTAGIAVLPDAPTGRYLVRFKNGAAQYFNAGGGEPGTATTWLVPCAPRTCADVPNSCGPTLDGCGGTLDCGGCPAGQTCGPSGVCGCIPQTCSSLGAACGFASDGCGGTLDCGGCAAPNVCDVVTANQCGCIATTCTAAGANCGTMPDGCSGTLPCGSCPNPGDVCGGTGIANQCGPNPCTPNTACGPTDCGIVSDGCGGIVDCGNPCVAPDVCGGGGTSNQCGCLPTTCDARGAQCGTIDDGCGNPLDCGPCPTGRTCSATNQCL